ncbi:hypothetical protein [Enterococcus durans]|nr:hypothetical protein [Enterococcus durans]
MFIVIHIVVYIKQKRLHGSVKQMKYRTRSKSFAFSQLEMSYVLFFDYF